MALKITSNINTGSGKGGQFGVGVNSIYFERLCHWHHWYKHIHSSRISFVKESFKRTTLRHPIPDSLMLPTWKVNLRKAIVKHDVDLIAARFLLCVSIR